MPTDEERRRFKEGMRRLFLQRDLPQKLAHSQIFDQAGDLRRDTFSRAMQSINADSNPGYPLVYTARTNEEVDEEILYNLVNHQLKSWLEIASDDLKAMSKKEAFLFGLVYPAMIFVKAEGTKEEKVARLIFGVSLVTNLVYRVLLGDYLDELKASWHTAQHKVGMDMYCDEGIAKLFSNADRLFDFASACGMEVLSSDVQGWEYQLRAWMSECWFDVYAECALPHRGFDYDLTWLHLWECLKIADVKTLVIDSDGTIFDLPYIMLSGKPITHAENSDIRDCLADTANGFSRAALEEIPSIANGDDCIEVTHPLGCELYDRLGFVITDMVPQSRDCLNFSSQIFTRNGGGYGRVPDGLQKALFSAIAANGNVEALAGIFNHVHKHPGFRCFVSAVKEAYKVSQGEESAELPFEVL